jgi:hypothetical protein
MSRNKSATKGLGPGGILDLNKLAKLRVEGSIPFTRSKLLDGSGVFGLQTLPAHHLERSRLIAP